MLVGVQNRAASLEKDMAIHPYVDCRVTAWRSNHTPRKVYEGNEIPCSHKAWSTSEQSGMTRNSQERRDHVNVCQVGGE